MELEAGCPICVNTALAGKFNRSEGLAALGRVRMLCRPFRALKTPESVFIADASAAAAVRGQIQHKAKADPMQVKGNGWPGREQT